MTNPVDTFYYHLSRNMTKSQLPVTVRVVPGIMGRECPFQEGQRGGGTPNSFPLLVSWLVLVLFTFQN